MAGQLLAAMHLPRPIADRDDLPVGGVSDISNRGSLDRLLTSELAQDDLTLAVRVAMGEALYLRREAPPRNPPRHRAVLIDAGIRLWGIPRVFATAVALAIAATADRHITVDVYRAKGQQIVPVDLTRREGLVEQMATLALDPHPGDALMPFVEAVSAQGPVADLVLITGEDVAADADFRRALAAARGPFVVLGNGQSRRPLPPGHSKRQEPPGGFRGTAEARRVACPSRPTRHLAGRRATVDRPAGNSRDEAFSAIAQLSADRSEPALGGRRQGGAGDLAPAMLDALARSSGAGLACLPRICRTDRSTGRPVPGGPPWQSSVSFNS